MISRYLKLLNTSRSLYLWWFLVVEASSLVHIIGAIWILVRVSHQISLPSGVRHDVCYSHISIGLRHSSVHCIDPPKLSRWVSSIVVGQEIPSIVCHHDCSILISDSILSMSHSLLLVIASRAVLDIRIISIVSLVFIYLVSNEYYVWLVDCCLVWTAMRALLVVGLASSERATPSCATFLVKSTHWVSTYILRRLGKVEQRRATWLCGGSNVSSVSKTNRSSLGLSIPHERFIISAKLQLLGQLLLCHIQSLMMHISLIGSSSQITWEMIFYVNDLSHVFHIITHSLSTLAVALPTWSEGSNTVCKILVFRSRAFKWVEVELVLVRGPADTPFIDLWRHLMFFALISRIINTLSRITELIKLSSSNVHWVGLCCIIWTLGCLVCRRVANLIAVTTCLRPAFNIILDLLLLLFVWVTDLDTLAYLGLLWSVQRIESSSLPSTLLWRVLNIVRGVINIWVVYSISWVPLWWARSLTTLRGNPPLTRLTSRIRSFVLILGGLISLILLLKKHLLLYLLFMELLTWSKIKVINDVGNVSHTILLLIWGLQNNSFLLEPVLY